MLTLCPYHPIIRALLSFFIMPAALTIFAFAFLTFGNRMVECLLNIQQFEPCLWFLLCLGTGFMPED
jgi:hypothetical protein